MTTDERINTIDLAAKLRKVADKLEGVNGRHRVKVDGEAFEEIVDVLAETHITTDEAVESIKDIGRGLFAYVERGVNPTTGKLVGVLHLTGNEWDISLKYSGGGVSTWEEIGLSDVSDENREAAIVELVKVAVSNGVLAQVFNLPALKTVDVSTLPVEVAELLAGYGYKVEQKAGEPKAESVSYQTPKLLNKSGRGKSGKQVATQKNGAGTETPAAPLEEVRK